jgi:E3 ubiquitin-protein ligase DOA10
MSYELQKVLAIESYKATDLHEFVKMCRYMNQILRDVNNKSRREEFSSDAARDEEVTVIVNSNQSHQNNDRSTSRPRFGIFESSSRAATQSSSENQMNVINCYNCEKLEHFSRNCRQFRKMNSNSFVREINVHEKNDSLSQENSESEAKKE